MKENSNPELMKRPHYSDEYVRRRAAELALPQIKQWYGVPECSDVELIHDLMRGLSASDGFDNAKSFEHLGWSVDSSLVQILEDGRFVRDARTELVKQWVKCLRITAQISVGADVTYHGRAGKIVGFDAETAEYRVSTPDLKPNQYLVCAAEEVIAVSFAEVA